MVIGRGVGVYLPHSLTCAMPRKSHATPSAYSSAAASASAAARGVRAHHLPLQLLHALHLLFVLAEHRELLLLGWAGDQWVGHGFIWVPFLIGNLLKWVVVASCSGGADLVVVIFGDFRLLLV